MFKYLAIIFLFKTAFESIDEDAGKKKFTSYMKLRFDFEKFIFI